MPQETGRDHIPPRDRLYQGLHGGGSPGEEGTRPGKEIAGFFRHAEPAILVGLRQVQLVVVLAPFGVCYDHHRFARLFICLLLAPC